jgi:ethanolamine utilization microcompartment shell protein EutL
MASLRSFLFIDQLQPQTMCFLGSWIRGSLPRAGMAAQIIEVAPGLDVEALTDVALKAADVRGGVLVVERQFGYLEIHSRDIAAVKAAAEAVLEALGVSPGAAMKPKILASRIVTRIDPGHAFLVNRNKAGSMILAGETLFVLETEPAAHAIMAANAAEKAATVKIVDYRMIGATGRLYLSGGESEVRAAAAAAEQALEH